jgi:hypothetical protein
MTGRNRGLSDQAVSEARLYCQSYYQLTLVPSALAPNAEAEIGSRPIPKEPMYLIINLGISENFGAVDYDGLEALWPVT